MAIGPITKLPLPRTTDDFPASTSFNADGTTGTNAPAPTPNMPPNGGGQDATSLLNSLYQNQPWGLAGGGRGSGFADRDYWLEHPSEILNGRLGRDLLGTGTDQPTGTPGTGPWQQSGQGALQAVMQGQQQGQAPVSSQADQILNQVEGNINGYVQQLLGQGQQNAAGI